MYTQCIMWKNTGRREMQKNTNFLKKKYLVLSSFGMALIFVILIKLKSIWPLYFLYFVIRLIILSSWCCSVIGLIQFRFRRQNNKIPDQQIGCMRWEERKRSMISINVWTSKLCQSDRLPYYHTHVLF